MKEVAFQWPLGFQSGATHAGFKDGDQLDFCWLVSKTPAAAAGVYTKNQFQAAPVQFTKQLINQHHELQAIVVNSGNANSFTGEEGLQNAQQTGQWAAEQLAIDPKLVGIASTGIIGKQLAMDKIQNGLKQLTLSDSIDAPEAIITTDTHSKKVCVQEMIDGKTITVTGFAKGSGMIHPNMGTTLSFISTDANVDAEALQNLLKQEIVNSFNQITVDGCMSTNDMVLTMANGASQTSLLTAEHPEWNHFKAAFLYVLVTLAKLVASDGEGASKLVEVAVHHAVNKAEANQVARAIVGSNLVKAMLFGEDANWGRIVQAIGQTTATVDPAHITIQFGNLTLVHNSTAQAVNADQLKKLLAKEQISINVDLNAGDADGLAWGCDLTYKYVEINAAYEG